MKYKKIKHGVYKYELEKTEVYDLGKIDLLRHYGLVTHLPTNVRTKIFDFPHPITKDRVTRVFVEPGFRWNGANVVPDWESTMRATCLHDALYELIDNGYLTTKARKVADKFFYKELRKAGFPFWRAAYWYIGVRFFGRFCI